jgi:ABC-type amino acid transport system permease subunit
MVTETFAVIEPYLMLALLYWASAALVSRAGRTAEFFLTEHLRR